jgi:HK97 family phage prohead protease
MEKIERRAYAAELRAGGNSSKLTGHAAVFNQEADIGGMFLERIERGAFTAAIPRDDVRALWNHNPDYVLGRNTAGTLSLREDETGLAVEITPPDTQWARDLMVSIKRGDVSQMSFGFQVTEATWDKTGERNVRVVRAVRLLDVSPVTFPAYSGTDVNVRSAAEIAADMDTGIVQRDLLRLSLDLKQREMEGRC